MKQKFVFKDNINNEVITSEVEIRNKMHLDAQIRFRAQVHKPKKGKGSFKRNNKKVDIDE